MQTTRKILFVEPFYGGSHKQLIDTIRKYAVESTLVTLTAKKWPWRARCGALILSELIPKLENEEILFCSSVLSLAELLGLRPDLLALKKVVYFHENQLVYPIQAIKDRDVQYAYNQITTCLAADVIFFNSDFNRTSFLDNISKIVKLLPDFRPKSIKNAIEAKCKVLYFPIDFKSIPVSNINRKLNVLHIIWPHRWEFDKGPDEFFKALFELKRLGCMFKVSVLGEQFSEVPEIFETAKKELESEILHFGYVESKEEYYRVLSTGHIVVSTAQHEFFGVAMLESVYCGCYPLVPNRLVYPEIYPIDCLYKNTEDLVKKLFYYIKNLDQLSIDNEHVLERIDLNKYSVETIVPELLNIIEKDVTIK